MAQPKLTEEEKAKLIAQLHDIREYIAIQIPQWVIICLGLLLFLAIVFFVYYKFIKKPPTPSLSLYELTIQKLKNFDYGLSSKNFYLEYSELIKNYLQKSLTLAVFEKTAEEIKPILVSNSRISTSNAVILSNIFTRGDLAKFARKEFELEQRAQDIQSTIVILEDIESILLAEQKAREEEHLAKGVQDKERKLAIRDKQRGVVVE